MDMLSDFSQQLRNPNVNRSGAQNTCKHENMLITGAAAVPEPVRGQREHRMAGRLGHELCTFASQNPV
jgi:hypothetical protein